MKAFSIVIVLLLPSFAYAQSWAERASRLNSKEVSAEEAVARGAADEQDKRNKICVRGIKPAMQGVDWNTDPTALPYMLYQVNKRTDLPIHDGKPGLDVATDELFEHTVVYLTAHTRWGFNEKETENMKRWLERGGTLFLDDCYLRGSPFTECVRPEVGKMIPGSEPRLALKDDPVIADAFRMIYPTPWPGEADFENRVWQYYALANRPAVLFTPNDDGCGWEISSPPSASNPIGEGIGHGGDNRQREIMYQWATNVLLFIYTH
jgi:hypothetical protein